MSLGSKLRVTSKERYHSVLRTVGLQTGGVQHPGVRPETVKLIRAGHGPYSADGVESSIRATLENDDLLGWYDDEGRRRLTLVIEADLVRIAEYWHERKSREDLKWINRALQEVRES